MGNILTELEEAVFRHQKESKKHNVSLIIEITKEECKELAKCIQEINTNQVNEVFTEDGAILQILGSKLKITVKK